MTTTHTWSISTMERNTADNGVTVCHWICDGTDGTRRSCVYGETSHAPDPTATSFINFEELTEEIVLGWVHASVDKDAIEASITSDIDQAANPVSTTGTPWDITT